MQNRMYNVHVHEQATLELRRSYVLALFLHDIVGKTPGKSIKRNHETWALHFLVDMYFR